ncbi:MAG TPA: hypothetical protein VFK80_08745, partial [Limnochordia bacterium]|nr:hypothetical protein [Limnochordia bacterium]
QGAFDAVDFNHFTQNFEQSVDDVIRNAMVNTVIGTALKGPLEQLAKDVQAQIITQGINGTAGSPIDMTAIKQDVANIENNPAVKGLFDAFKQLGLAGKKTADAFNAITESSYNLPEIIKLSQVRFHTAAAISGNEAAAQLARAAGIPGFATGGVVHAQPGGTLVRVGEGGQDEAIVPLGGRGGAGGGSVHIGTVIVKDGRDFGRQVDEWARRSGRRLTGNAAPALARGAR